MDMDEKKALAVQARDLAHSAVNAAADGCSEVVFDTILHGAKASIDAALGLDDGDTLPDNGATRANIQGWANRYLDEHLHAAVEATVKVELEHQVQRKLDETVSRLYNNSVLGSIIYDDEVKAAIMAVVLASMEDVTTNDDFDNAVSSIAQRTVEGLVDDGTLADGTPPAPTLDEVLNVSNNVGQTISELVDASYFCESGLVEALMKAVEALYPDQTKRILREFLKGAI
jgi:hypothetical protein